MSGMIAHIDRTVRAGHQVTKAATKLGVQAVYVALQVTVVCDC